MRVVFLSVLLFGISCLASSQDTNEKKVVCYFGGWSVYRPGNGKFEISSIDPYLCTHVIYSFAGLGHDGTIKSLDPYADLADNYGKDGFGKLYQLKEQNPNLKTMIAMGGWNEGSTKYSQAVKTPEGRTKLANSIVDFVRKYRFDGFDLDWEYPNQRGGSAEDKQNLNLFLKELKGKLSQYGLQLSIAVGAAEKSASLSYNIPELAQNVDFINLMTYDFHGANWESKLGLNAPLYARPEEREYDSLLNVDAAVNYWLHQGAPSEKLILGVPFYGQSFRLSNPSQTEPGAPSSGPGNAGPYTQQPGTLSYMELCEKFGRESWTHKYDSYQRVPYSYNGNQWVGYDNPESLKEKANYAKSKKLGGMMLWSLESDDFKGVCGEKYPLLRALNAGLKGNVNTPTRPVPEYTTQTPNPSNSSPVTSTTQQSIGETNVPNQNEICTTDGYVRDPKDCTKFYFCARVGDEFQSYEFHCPAGLYFNPAINTCDYPGNVDCTMQYQNSNYYSLFY